MLHMVSADCIVFSKYRGEIMIAEIVHLENTAIKLRSNISLYNAITYLRSFSSRRNSIPMYKGAAHLILSKLLIACFLKNLPASVQQKEGT